MGKEERSGGGVSRREIAAAWACCGLVLLGAIAADLGAARDDGAAVAYAGAHIPGGAGRPREPQADYDQDRNPASDIGLFANDSAPIAIGSDQTSATGEAAHQPRLASRLCRYLPRQPASRYSAAAQPVAAVRSGEREAVQ